MREYFPLAAKKLFKKSRSEQAACSKINILDGDFPSHTWSFATSVSQLTP